MKCNALLLLLALLLPSISFSQAPATAEKLAKLKQSYDRVFEAKNAARLQDQLKLLDRQYQTALTSTAERLAKQGQDGDAFTQELSLLAEGKLGLPSPAAAAPAVAELRRTYLNQKQKLQQSLDAAIGPARNSYIRELQQFRDKLRSQQLMDESRYVEAALQDFTSTLPAASGPAVIAISASNSSALITARINVKTDPDAAQTMIAWMLAEDPEGVITTDQGRIGGEQDLQAAPKGRVKLTRIETKTKSSQTSPFPWHLLEGLGELEMLGIDCQHKQPVSAGDLAHLRNCGNLRTLELGGNFEAGASAGLPLLPNVFHATLNASTCYDEFANFAARLPAVTWLHTGIGAVELTPAQCAGICLFTKLQTLEIGYLTVPVAMELSKLTSLRHIGFWTSTRIIEPAAIRHLQSLTGFSTRGSFSALLPELARLPNLEALGFGAEVEPTDLAALIQSSRLRSFSFVPSGTGRSFRPGQKKVVQHIPTLTQIPHLEELSLQTSDVTDTELAQLATMKGLKRLDVRHTYVTDDGARAFARKRPKCELIR